MKRLVKILLVYFVLNFWIIYANNCMEFILENWDSFCIWFEKKDSEAIIQDYNYLDDEVVQLHKDYVWDKFDESEFVYSVKQIPLYFKVVSSNLSKPYDLKCKDILVNWTEYKSCNWWKWTNVIPIKDPGWFIEDAMLNPRKLYIEYDDWKRISTNYSVDEKWNIYYQDWWYIEYATEDYDIVFKTYKRTRWNLSDKDTYLKFNEVKYSIDWNNWIDITNNRKSYFHLPSNWNVVINNGVLYPFDAQWAEWKYINWQPSYWTNPSDGFIPTNWFIYDRTWYYKFQAHLTPIFEYDPWTSESWESNATASIYVPWVIRDSSVDSEISGQNHNMLEPEKPIINPIFDEFKDAYDFAFENWITTMDNIEKANMEGWLTRIAMAKMLSQYAINILKKTPDTNKECKFSDVSEELDTQYNNGVTLSCQLWIMGVWITEFRPNDEVTRAEFGTALSRMLYGTADWEWAYYKPHLEILKQLWIITNDNPELKELRWYVMIMLMRSAE